MACAAAGARTPAAISSATIAQQDLNLAHRPGLAEELRRDIGNLVRLVENDGLRARQQIAEALLLEREIREQQMVIHHDDVGRLGIAPRLEHMAARELRALLPQTILARRGDHRPHRRLLRQVGELRQVAGLVVAAQRDTRASTRAEPRSPSSERCAVASSSRCRHR